MREIREYEKDEIVLEGMKKGAMKRKRGKRKKEKKERETERKK